MSYRRLTDATGRRWEVWDSRPTIIDRRSGERRISVRANRDRRQRAEARVAVSPEYRDGWLVFQSGAEWRRLAPIPVGWQAFDDGALIELLNRATAIVVHGQKG